MASYKDCLSVLGVEAENFQQFALKVANIFGVSQHIVFQICSDDYQRVADVTVFYKELRSVSLYYSQTTYKPEIVRFWYDNGTERDMLLIYETHVERIRGNSKNTGFVLDTEFSPAFLQKWLKTVKQIAEELHIRVFNDKPGEDLVRNA